jgi:hypothetical protein
MILDARSKREHITNSCTRSWQARLQDHGANKEAVIAGFESIFDEFGRWRMGKESQGCVIREIGLAGISNLTTRFLRHGLELPQSAITDDLD